MADLYLYARTKGSTVITTLDTGQAFIASPVFANGRDDAHLTQFPPGTSSQGAVFRNTCDGKRMKEIRGIVNVADTDTAFVEFDDFGELEDLAPEPPGPEPTPEPDPNADPLAIITAVYEAGDFDLSTKDGNGQFTEAACEALHLQHSPHWGHIRKTGAQNQYNGHAVDAIMTLYPIGETAAGGYDIVLNSVSPDAEPTFHYAGGPDPNLWYYPAAPVQYAALNTQLVDLSDEIQQELGDDDLVIKLLEVVDRLVRGASR